jgi:hypothetical protein
MSLTEDNSIRNLQERYEALGSVLDAYAFNIVESAKTDYDTSLEAVIMAMNSIIKEADGSQWGFSPDPAPDLYFKIKIYEDATPKGERITLADFLGPGYNLRICEVEIFTYYENVRGTSIMEGLAHALLDPPHGIRFMDTHGKYSVAYGLEEQKKMTEFFNNYLKEVLLIPDVSDTDHLVIHKWSDDWSNYFDDGKEWWGAFCWSVLDKKKNRITVLAASTTD